MLATLEVTEVTAEDATIRWRIANGSPGPIWVPTKWGLRHDREPPPDEPRQSLPYPMLAPPADVMLVWGDLKSNRLHGTIFEGADWFGAARIAAGEALEGEFYLPLPVGGRSFENVSPLVSPYQHERDAGLIQEQEKAVAVRRVEAVQMAVRYWTHDPFEQPLDRLEAWASDPMYRLTAARALVTGDKPWFVDRDAFGRFVLSSRVKVDLPAKPGLKLYYTGKRS